VLPSAIVDRIRREHGSARTLGDIARALTADGVPTAHGGRQWWPSTIRSVLARSVKETGTRRPSLDRVGRP
jgi:hypothetical protein